MQRFLKEYWSLTREQRQREHQTLISEANEFPEILIALERVELGLDVDQSRLNSEKDAELKELGQIVCDQFLMGQFSRVQSRRRWQSEQTSQEQRNIARRLKSYYPSIAALEEAWIHRLLRNEPYYVPPKPLIRKVIYKTSQVIDASFASDWSKALLIVVGTIVGVVAAMYGLGKHPPQQSLRYNQTSPKFEYPKYEFPKFNPNLPPSGIESEQLRVLLELARSGMSESEYESLKADLDYIEQKKRFLLPLSDPKPAIAEKP